MFNYLVQQGVISSDGQGDMVTIFRTCDYNNALKAFNEYKTDGNGWTIPKGHFLYTILMAVDGDTEDTDEYVEILEEYEYFG